MKNQITMSSTILASLVALVLLPAAVVAFVPTTPATFSLRQATRIQSTSSQDPVQVNTDDEMFPDATILEFTLEQHKPLGCTVEESLAHTKEKHVFVTKVCAMLTCINNVRCSTAVRVSDRASFPCRLSCVDCSLSMTATQKQLDCK